MGESVPFQETRIRAMLEKQVVDTGGEAAYMHDAQYHAQIHQLGTMLTMVDRAMRLEGVDRLVRDRVVKTVIYGVPNPIDAEARIEQIAATYLAIPGLRQDWPDLSPE